MVFDEVFVRSARIHEPTAQERILAAAQARAEAESARLARGIRDDDSGPDAGDRDDGYRGSRLGDDYDPEWDEDDERYELARGYRRRSSHTRWHRTVAWVLAVVMGIGVIALTVAAIYRGTSGGRQQPAPPPPGTSRLDAPPAPISPPVAEPAAPLR